MGKANFRVKADFLEASGKPSSSLWSHSLASIAASTAAVYICSSKEESSIGPLPGPKGEELYLISRGTCFAVHEEGYFVTAGHVVETDHPIYIALHSASQVPCGIFRACTLKVIREADLHSFVPSSPKQPNSWHQPRAIACRLHAVVRQLGSQEAEHGLAR